MAYEPHTDRLAADEQCDLPPNARGVTVARDGDEYLVHYLALTDEAREARREEIQELIEKQGTDGKTVEIRG